MLFLPPTKVNNLGVSSATYIWAIVTRESCKVLLPPKKLLYVGRWILLEAIIPDNCGETRRTSFTERGGIAYFFRDRFFCDRENYRYGSAARLLFAQRHGGIVPRQICAEGGKFDGLRTGRWDPKQHIRPGCLGILVSVLVSVGTVIWVNFLLLHAREKKRRTHRKAFSYAVLATPDNYFPPFAEQQKSRSQRRGRGFDPLLVHHPLKQTLAG